LNLGILAPEQAHTSLSSLKVEQQEPAGRGDSQVQQDPRLTNGLLHAWRSTGCALDDAVGLCDNRAGVGGHLSSHRVFREDSQSGKDRSKEQWICQSIWHSSSQSSVIVTRGFLPFRF
jgi:hypothetical protein